MNPSRYFVVGQYTLLALEDAIKERKPTAALEILTEIQEREGFSGSALEAVVSLLRALER